MVQTNPPMKSIESIKSEEFFQENMFGEAKKEHLDHGIKRKSNQQFDCHQICQLASHVGDCFASAKEFHCN